MFPARRNKRWGSEFGVQCRMEPPAPKPSPIRRIINDSIVLTGALTVMAGAILLCCRQPGPREIWVASLDKMLWEVRLGYRWIE